MTPTKKQPKKVGLALGGGGAKGLSHIGVIKALERVHVPVSYIAGTSIGAVIGAWYAATGEVDSLREFFKTVKPEDINSTSKLLMNKDGNVFKRAEILSFLESGVRGKTFADLKIPLTIVATDAETGHDVAISSGDVLSAVKASMALPMLFPQVAREGKMLIDGGFSNPVPADVVRNMGAEYVIAVDVSSDWVNTKEFNVWSLPIVLDRALSIVEYQLARHILKQADVVLCPPVLSYSWLAFDQVSELFAHGMNEAVRKMDEILRGANYPIPEKKAFEKFMDFILYQN